MNHPEIVLRQAHLLQRSTLLRQRLLSDAATFRGPLAAADQAYISLRWLCLHPAWPLGALSVWMALKPKRLFQIAGRAWWVYRLVSQWRKWSAAWPKFLN
jgi:hypothetical protein